MPSIKINGCNYHYDIYGSGTETILFSHGLLWSGYLFHKQVAYFKDRYRIVTYDHRGQGRSEATAEGYEMDQLYEDAVTLIEQLQLGKVHFVGLSMGGFVGMRLAARRPDLIRSLALTETSAQDEPNVAKYWFLNTIVKWFGINNLVVGPVMKIMFGKKFLNDPQRAAERMEWIGQLKQNKKTITRAVNGVIKRQAAADELNKVTCPTLVVVGTQDIATTPAKAEFLHSKIPQSKLVYIEGAGHTSCVEEPEQYNTALEQFWNGLE